MGLFDDYGGAVGVTPKQGQEPLPEQRGGLFQGYDPNAPLGATHKIDKSLPFWGGSDMSWKDLGLDVLKSAGTGAVRAGEGAVGLPGTLAAHDLAQPETATPGKPLGQAAQRRNQLRSQEGFNPTAGLPTIEQVQQTVEPALGGLHESETRLGRAAQYGVNTLLSPGGIGRRLLSAALPAAGEQIGEAVGGEKGAIAGSVLGGLPTSLAPRRAPAAPNWSDAKLTAKLGYDVQRGTGTLIPVHPTDISDEIDKIVDPAVGSLRRRKQQYTPEGKATSNKLEELRDTPNPDAADVYAMVQTLRDGKEYGAAGLHAADKLMDFIERGTPSTNPHTKGFLDEIKTANANWAAGSTAEEIEQAIKSGSLRAAGSGKGTNLGNVLQQKARQLLESSKSRYYSDQVKADLEHVAKGGNPEKLLRIVSMFNPGGIVSVGLDLVASKLTGMNPLEVMGSGMAANMWRERRLGNAFNKVGENVLKQSPYGQQPQFQRPPRRIVLPTAVNAILGQNPESNGGP